MRWNARRSPPRIRDADLGHVGFEAEILPGHVARAFGLAQMRIHESGDERKLLADRAIERDDVAVERGNHCIAPIVCFSSVERNIAQHPQHRLADRQLGCLAGFEGYGMGPGGHIRRQRQVDHRPGIPPAADQTAPGDKVEDRAAPIQFGGPDRHHEAGLRAFLVVDNSVGHR